MNILADNIYIYDVLKVWQCSGYRDPEAQPLRALEATRDVFFRRGDIEATKNQLWFENPDQRMQGNSN